MNKIHNQTPFVLTFSHYLIKIILNCIYDPVKVYQILSYQFGINTLLCDGG
jgi:hypothetical protein